MSEIKRPILLSYGNRKFRTIPQEILTRLNLSRYDVDPQTGCHLWRGAINENGYPIVGTMHYGRFRAHRAAYERKHGPIAAGDQLDHLCRVRHCINPDHLEPVSNAENTRRGAKAILSAEDVDEIRRLRSEEHLSYRKLAKRFGVSSCAISNIFTRKRWYAQ